MRTCVTNKKFLVIKYKINGFVKELGDKKEYWNWGVFTLQEPSSKSGHCTTRESAYNLKATDEYRVNHAEEFIIDCTQEEAAQLIEKFGLVLTHKDADGEIYDTPDKRFKKHWDGRDWQKYVIR